MSVQSITKVDLAKDLGHLYRPAARGIEVVDVPAMQFLMIDGEGDPNTGAAFGQAVSALFSVAYTLKFMVRGSAALDYHVMPLEGLWWSPDGAVFTANRRADWRWTAMIMQPEQVTPELFAEARVRAARKKDLPALPDLRLETFREGLAVQVLHRGPFANEAPVIVELHEFIAAQGHQLRGKHHEIYLNDVTRTAPEKLRTILRQPFA
jgi:hypothetical protein